MHAEWVDIVSQHAVRTATRVPNTYVMRCGRMGQGRTHELDMNRRSCETCLRLLAHDKRVVA